MKNKRILFFFAILMTGLLLSACSGASLQATSWPGLTVQDDMVYVAYQQQVFAIQAENGIERATFPNELERTSDYVFAAPAYVDESNMFLSTYNNRIVNINPTTGAENCSFENSNRFLASALVTDAGIFAPNADHMLYALDTDCKELWTFESDDPLWGTPASNGNSIYIGSMDHHLYALNAQTGKTIWSTDLGGTTVGTPAIAEDGTLYIGTFESEAYALDGETGDILWRVPTQGWVWAGPSLSEDDSALYITDLDGYLYAVDTTDGTIIWQIEGDGPSPGSPLVLNDSIYFTTGGSDDAGGTIYAINPDGGIRWSKTMAVEDAQIYTPAVASGDMILIGIVNTDQLVIAYDANGNQKWEFTPGN
ncbi:MAG: PQQ-like beta-propeller repeat protein [Chloroflexota bacterium]